MGRLKPRPTFSPHSSRYWTSSRRATVARAHVVVLIGHPVSRNANVLNQKRFLIAPSFRFVTEWSVFFQPIDAPRFGLLPDVSSDHNYGLDPSQSPVNTSRLVGTDPHVVTGHTVFPRRCPLFPLPHFRIPFLFDRPAVLREHASGI